MRRTSGALATLREEAEHCRACPLYENATQVVFGEGRSTARIVPIGEQAGDREGKRSWAQLAKKYAPAWLTNQ